MRQGCRRFVSGGLGPFAGIPFIPFIVLMMVLAVLDGAPSVAGLVEIIHTNDLHSHMDHAGDEHRGGFSAVKAVIDRVKARAQGSQIPSLVLDAGDFSEGGELYFADGGFHSFDILTAMGFDAVALGNHDYLMGPSRLDQILGLARFPFPMVAANFRCAGFSQINQSIKPYASFSVGQGASRVRLAILGLTTDDANYTWRAAGGCEVLDPLAMAREWVPRLRRDHDFVIALTHLGVDRDKDLIRHTEGIDLIVGGHSHTALQSPDAARNQRGQIVPIVQAGMHGMFVGDLLMDVYPGSPLQVLRYKLHPVDNQVESGDGAVAAKVAETHRALNQNYSSQWLQYPIGYSEVPLKAPNSESTEWGDFVAEAMRQVGGAEVAFELGRFQGLEQPQGVVRRLNLMVAYPRLFEVERRLGWNVWVAHVPGFFIESTLRDLVNKGISFSVAGLEVVTEPTPGTGWYRLRSVSHQGRPLESFRFYQMAMPEGIVRGALASQPGLAAFVIRDPFDTRVSAWTAVERHFRRVNRVLRAYPEGTARIHFNPDFGLH